MTVSVQNESKVDLSLNIDTFMDQNCIDFQTITCGLMGLQVVANHLGCLLSNFFGGFQDLNTSLETTTESTFASASSMNLSLENENAFFDVKIFGNFFCTLGSSGDISSLNEDTEFAHEVFALVLVEVEESSDGSGERFGDEGSEESG